MLIFEYPVNRITVAGMAPLVSYPSLPCACLCHHPLPFCFLRFFGLCSGVGRWLCLRVVVAGSIKSAWVSSWWFGFIHRFSLYCVIWYLLIGLVLFHSNHLPLRTTADCVCRLCSLLTYMVLLDYNYNFLAIRGELSQQSCLIHIKYHFSFPAFSSGLTSKWVPCLVSYGTQFGLHIPLRFQSVTVLFIIATARSDESCGTRLTRESGKAAGPDFSSVPTSVESIFFLWEGLGPVDEHSITDGVHQDMK